MTSARALTIWLLALAVVLANGCSSPSTETVDHAGDAVSEPEFELTRSEPVGTIPGHGAVRQGAFHYTVPLKVPAGRLGLEPELALEYSSRGGESEVGFGFSLLAGSSITRCRKTLATHGVVESVRFDTSDGFCLDGEKLFVIDQGAGWSEYRTHRTTFSKIVGYGSLSDGSPEYFDVWSKDGRIHQYGRTSNARSGFLLAYDLSTTPHSEDGGLGDGTYLGFPVANWKQPVNYAWHISTVRDRHDNAMEYRYIPAAPGSAHRVVESIRYTGTFNAQQGAITSWTREVRFVYVDDAAAWPSYLSGLNTTNSKLLKTIEMWAPFPIATGKVWEYRLEHSPSETTTRFLLRSLIWCDAEGVCMPPTKFDWVEPEVGFDLTEVGPLAGPPNYTFWARVLLADFDGDGCDDLLHAGEVPVYGGSYPENRSLALKLRLSQCDGTFGPDQDVTQQVTPWPYGGAAFSPGDLRIAHLTADGRAQLAVRRPNLDWNGDPCNYFGISEAALSHCVKWNLLAYDGSQFQWLGEFDNSRYANPGFADVDGDGLQDLLQLDDHPNPPDPLSAFALSYALNDGTANPMPAFVSGLQLINTNAGLLDTYYGRTLASGTDVYSDGLTDLLAPRSGLFYTLLHRSRFGTWWTNDTSWNNHGSYYNLVDVNGDDIPDMVHPGSQSTEAIRYRLGTGVGLLASEVTLPTSPPPLGPLNGEDDYLRSADFDGDSRADLLFLSYDPTGWYGTTRIRGHATGSKLFLPRRGPGVEGVSLPASGYRLQGAYTGLELVKGTWSGAAVGDVDGDGLADVVQIATPYEYEIDVNDAPPRRRLDPNGDWEPTTEPPVLQLIRPNPSRRGQKPDKLTRIVDGLGRVDHVYYATIRSVAHDVYTSGSGCVHPQRCDKKGIDVVREWTTGILDLDEPSTSSIEYDFTYAYEDARSDAQGRGFLGFGKITETNEKTGAQSTEVYEHSIGLRTCPGHVYPFSGFPSRTITRELVDEAGIDILETSVERKYCVRFLDWSGYGDDGFASLGDFFDFVNPGYRRPPREGLDCELHNLDPGAVPPVLQQTCDSLMDRSYAVELVQSTETTKRFYNGQGVSPTLTRTQANTYDRWGNVLVQHTEHASSGSQPTETDHVATTYQNTQATWLLGLPIAVLTSSTVDGVTASRSETRDYNGNTGDLLLHIDEPAGTPDVRLETYFEYAPAALGQVTKITEQALAGIRVTDLFYDGEKIHAVRINDPVNNDHYAYPHPAFGVTSLAIDPNGFETVYVLDGFGRVREAAHDDGYKEWTTYGDSVVGAMTTSRLAVTGEYTTQSVDALARIISRRWKNFDGDIIEQSYRRDPDQRHYEHTLPAPENGPPGPTVVTEFDGAGRVVRKIHADSASRVWTYPSLLEVLETDETGDFKRAELDVRGRVARLIEPNGIYTSYKYRPFGDLASVTDPGAAVTTTTTDIRGRVRTLVDPNAGSFLFEYDGFGNLVREVAGPREVLYDHDQIGRVIGTYMTDADDEREIYFVHDACANGRGRTCSTFVRDHLDGSEITKDFEYDVLGREIKRILSIDPGGANYDGGIYKMEKQYDAFGRISRLLYPEAPGLENEDRFKVDHAYQNGFLARVFWAGKDVTFWKAESYESNGRLKDSALGDDGLREERSYSSTRGWLNQLLIKKGAALALESTSYQFEADGNVEQRIQAVWHGSTSIAVDAFTYDGLDRLKTWTGTGHRNADVEYFYSPAGNINQVTEAVLGGATGQFEEYEHFAGTQRVRRFRPRGGSFSPVFSYDALGRLTDGYFGDGEAKFTYTAQDLPRHIERSALHLTTDFAYDASGVRVVKLEDEEVETNYLDEFYERREAEHVFHVFAGDQRVAQMSSDGSVPAIRYFTQDALETVATSWLDMEPERQYFSPFGERMALDGTPASAPPIGDVTRGFAGHEHDDALGLINMGGRVYVPRLRRFASPDPLAPPNLRTSAVCLTGDCEDQGDVQRIGRNRAAGAVQPPAQLAAGLADSNVSIKRSVSPVSTETTTSGGATRSTPGGSGSPPFRSQHGTEIITGQRAAIGLDTGQRHHRYSYAWNSPLRMNDPTGLSPGWLVWLEAAVDGLAVGMDAKDAHDSYQKGEHVYAAVMVLALSIDLRLAVMPGAPAGAGATVRSGKEGVEAAGDAARRLDGQIANALYKGDAKDKLSNAIQSLVEGLCFAADTPVWTAKGIQPISDLAEGDLVLATEEDGSISFRKVARVFRTEAQPLMALWVAADDAEPQILEVTVGHPFYHREKGWTAAEDLRPGDELGSASGRSIRVVSMATVAGLHTVYNLEIEGAHTYHVGEADVLVHNTPHCGRKELPLRDATGKVHGDLPHPRDFKNYSADELRQLRDDLKESVQERIRKTDELGRDRPHGQRQGEEQELIRQIEKHLDDMEE